MGFFSKIFKGVKNVFKKIGKGIKSAFKSIGKFMGKLGIVGQIGLGLFMPYLGGMLGKWAIGAMGSSNAIVSAAGNFVNAAINIGTKAGTAFKSVTEGVVNVVGETVGAVLNTIPGADKAVQGLTGGKINIGDNTFGTVFKEAQTAMTNIAESGSNLFKMDTLTAKNKLGLEQIAKDEMKPEIAEIKSQLKEAIEEKQEKSLLDKPVTIDYETPDITEEIVEEAAQPKSFADKVTDFVSDTGEELTKEAKSSIVDQTLTGLNLKEDPELEYNTFVASIPTIDLGTTSGIRMAKDYGFDPRAFEQNINYFNENPIGGSAVEANLYRQYKDSFTQPPVNIVG